LPPDTKLSPISRTIGDNQLVDEVIFSFTHTHEILWMLCPASLRRTAASMSRSFAIVPSRDGELAHEHIYWDQASLIKQIGLLTDPKLPVYGAETARRVTDPKFQPG